MIRAGIRFPIGTAVLLCARLLFNAHAAETPDFQEVYSLVKEHAAGLTESDLNRAATLGFLQELGPRVDYVPPGTQAAAPSGAVLVESTNYDAAIVYLRVQQVQPGLAGAIRNAYHGLSQSNSAAGLVIDLRFADGSDYAAIPEVAGLFTGRAVSLLDWGAGMKSSQAGSETISMPVAVLVNEKTERAAEALAAVLRETGSALVLGSRTAGRANVMKSFPLKNGGQLQIATSPVHLADGSVIGPNGVAPDIRVEASLVDERIWLTNAYAVLNTNLLAEAARTGTNAATLAGRRLRMSEAELVREHREGLDRSSETEEPVATDEPPPAVVRDPVLARALDVLKGLAVLRQNRS